MDAQFELQRQEELQKAQQNMLGVLLGAATGALIGFVLSDQKRRQFIWDKVTEIDNNSFHLLDHVKEKTDEYKKGGVKRLTKQTTEELLD